MPPPDRLGRYAVRRRLGSGGFATVWLAYDEQLDAPVAVKVLADNWTEDHQVRTRFVEEGRYLRRVESPHVVSVFDAGELDDGRPYLVMSYADQGTLNDRLTPGAVDLRLGEALDVVRQVAAGLQALHDRDILHRDVKPANVLFRTVAEPGGTTALRAMVGDLGLGKALDGSSRLTMIAGTPSYVAPEQAQGESPDGRADQYSLAVLTYRLLTGRTPWAHADLVSAAAPPPPPPASSVGRAFPDEVERVLRRALSPRPDDRWPTVTAYADALLAAFRDSSDLDSRTSPVSPVVDADLTQPGNRPSPPPAARDPLPPLPSAPGGRAGGRGRTRRLVLAAASGLLALGLGSVAGWFAVTGLRADDRTLRDARGQLSVTVPDSWGQVADRPWTPPGSDGRYAALSAGSTSDWATNDGSEGVFLGLLPQDALPTRLPDHGCGSTDQVITDTLGGDPTRTRYAGDCPGVLVDRVVQVADDRVLWVQVRAEDRSTAIQVLGSVQVVGLG